MAERGTAFRGGFYSALGAIAAVWLLSFIFRGKV